MIGYIDRYKNKMSKERCSNSEFYLSNTLPDKFDETKVGKVKKGIYIIEKGKNRIYRYKVLKITKTQFIWELVLKKSDGVIGQPGPVVYYRK